MSDADNIRALLDKGLTSYGLGQVEEALSTWRRVLELDPGNPRAKEYINFVEQNWAPGTSREREPYRPDEGSDAKRAQAAEGDAAPAAVDPHPPPQAEQANVKITEDYTPPAKPVMPAAEWGDLYDFGPRDGPVGPAFSSAAPAPPAEAESAPAPQVAAPAPGEQEFAPAEQVPAHGEDHQAGAPDEAGAWGSLDGAFASPPPDMRQVPSASPAAGELVGSSTLPPHPGKLEANAPTAFQDDAGTRRYDSVPTQVRPAHEEADPAGQASGESPAQAASPPVAPGTSVSRQATPAQQDAQATQPPPAPPPALPKTAQPPAQPHRAPPEEQSPGASQPAASPQAATTHPEQSRHVPTRQDTPPGIAPAQSETSPREVQPAATAWVAPSKWTPPGALDGAPGRFDLAPDSSGIEIFPTPPGPQIGDRSPVQQPGGAGTDGVTGDQVMDLVAGGSSPARHAGSGAQDEKKALVQGARDLLELDDFSGALEILEKLVALDPSDQQASAMLSEAEQGLSALLSSKLGDLGKVPRVSMAEEEIIWLNLDHRAGFILSLVDGHLTFDEILSVCGLSQLEGMRILVQLLQEKVIEIV